MLSLASCQGVLPRYSNQAHLTPQEEESGTIDTSSAPPDRDEDLPDFMPPASLQPTQNIPPVTAVGASDLSQAVSSFHDPQGSGNLRLDDESEYPPLTVHND